MAKKRLVVGITGSSGTIYGIRILQALSQRADEIETHLILSPSAEKTLGIETKWSVQEVKRLANVTHDHGNLAASIASGSFKTSGMIVAPCSMKTLAAIAHGLTGDLITRAADVMLKEKRPLIVAPRETPLHLGHLRNMVALAETGASIVPPIPAFYHQPATVDDIVNHTVGKILDLIHIEHDLFTRWGHS
jgi:flavin prenyltransferase